jgi:hypothetical protein
MSIQNGGNVGIGTQSPGAKLEVNGSVKMNGLRLGTASTDGSVLTSDGAGNGTWNSGLRVLSVSRQFSTAQPITASENLIGGYNNAVASGTIGATALGGGYLQTRAFFPFTVLSAGSNYVSGDYAAAIGGLNNVAAGSYSFAAGRRAQANHNGAFVWADSQNVDFSSTTNDQFSIRAQNGVRLDNSTSLHFSNRRRQMLNLFDDEYGLGVQDSTLYERTQDDFAWYRKGTHADAYGDAGGGTEQMRLDGAGKLTVRGEASVCALTIRGGCDLAEPFPMSREDIPKGSLVVIDEENAGRLKLAERAYDTRVAGIVSGANGVNSGITLRQEGLLEGGQNVALSGRVYALADASNGPIKPGDLLTSSATPGHVMKVTDRVQAQGTIVGKAMSALKEGKGMVLVLVSLQ